MQDITMFFVLLFFAVVFISQALILPAAGSKAKHKELANRLKETQSNLDEESRSLLQEHYLKSLTPLDRRLVQVKAFASLKKTIELSGFDWSLSQTLGVTTILSLGVGLLLLILGQLWYLCLAAVAFVWVCLHMILQKKISDRLSKFEEQLPDALDIIRRMLQAGQPITQAFNEVGNEMPAPIGIEFKNTFNLLNYGYDMRLAMTCVWLSCRWQIEHLPYRCWHFQVQFCCKKRLAVTCPRTSTKCLKFYEPDLNWPEKSKPFPLKVVCLPGFWCCHLLFCLW